MSRTDKHIGLYIHVPFCLRRCSYCDFYSLTDTRKERVEAYVESVKESLAAWSPSCRGHLVGTIYFGGGTPAMLGRYICDIIEEIRSHFELADQIEITVEANPGSLSGDIVGEWVEAGVNRISLGVQSFDKDALKLLGRSHTVDDTMRALALLDEHEVAVSIDLMCGIPNQDQDAWRAQLEMGIACDPDHLSIYPLTFEEGTDLAQRVASEAIIAPDADEVALQMEMARDLLTDDGYHHYEVANYAKPGRESRHNLGYWQAVPYVGIGSAAASMLNCEDGSRIRGINHASLDAFLGDPQRVEATRFDEVEILSAEEAAREDLMLGMRLMQGVDAVPVRQTGLEDVFEQLCGAGLVRRCGDPGRYQPTPAGWLLGNEIYGAIWNQSR